MKGKVVDNFQESLINDRADTVQVAWVRREGERRAVLTVGKVRWRGRAAELAHREQRPVVVSVGAFIPQKPGKYAEIVTVDTEAALVEEVGRRLEPFVIDERTVARSAGIRERGLQFLKTGHVRGRV